MCEGSWTAGYEDGEAYSRNGLEVKLPESSVAGYSWKTWMSV